MCNITVQCNKNTILISRRESIVYYELYQTKLQFNSLNGNESLCNSLHFTSFHCTTLHTLALKYTTVRFFLFLQCTALHYTSQNCTALHYAALGFNHSMLLNKSTHSQANLTLASE